MISNETFEMGKSKSVKEVSAETAFYVDSKANTALVENWRDFM